MRTLVLYTTTGGERNLHLKNSSGDPLWFSSPRVRLQSWCQWYALRARKSPAGGERVCAKIYADRSAAQTAHVPPSGSLLRFISSTAFRCAEINYSTKCVFELAYEQYFITW